MVSPENRVILTAVLATVAGLILVGVVELTVGFPGSWGLVFAFVVFVALGFVFPQLYLLTKDTSTSRVSRLGVISFMTVLLGFGFSANARETEAIAIWTIVALALAVIFIAEARVGYQESRP